MLTLVLALTLAANDAITMIGTVRVVGPAQDRGIQVFDDAKTMTVTGELADEVAQLQSLKVEVVGFPAKDGIDVREYRIIDVGGGVKPFVGVLERTGDRLALRDGDADAIPLNLGARTLGKLMPMAGAKVWVAGTKLLSGELKVTKYGVLRKPRIEALKSEQQPVPQGE
jgi:hypothetical protein